MQLNKSNTNKEIYLLLRDKVKYLLSLRKLENSNEVADIADSINQVVSTNLNSNKSNNQLKTFLKSLKQTLPEWVMFNSISSLFYKLVERVIDAKVISIQKNIKTNLILFGTSLPQKFEFPIATNSPLVSIIIPVHNKYEYTHRSLFSIREHSIGVDYEVIIADDASTDETFNIKDNIKNLTISRNDVSLGFLENCNTAASLANGKYILFLNNDTVVQPNWLNSLVNLLENDSTIGMTGSKLIYPDGLLQEAGGIIWSDGSGWNYGKFGQPNAPEYNYLKEVDFISGASILIRSSLWNEIGSFDKRFIPAYYEDTDLAFEVRKKGYKVVYQPLSVVVHFEGISHGTDTNSGIKNYQLVNKEKFVTKWKNELEKGQFKNESQLFLARDRSKNKKTMLFIDHFVPEPDKDAGGKSCMQYLQLFTEMGFNIKFIGDNYLKAEPYTTALQQMGVEVLFGYHYQQNWKEWFLQNQNDILCVFLNRPFVTAKYIDFIKLNSSAKIIYFGHDLHFLREERQFQIENDKSLLDSAKRWKEIELDIFSKSDLVLFPSNIEVEEVKNIDSSINAAVIPLNIFKTSTGIKSEIFPDDKRDLLFVGGFNHLPNVDAMIWFCKEIFPQVLKINNQIKLFIVGSNMPKDVIQLGSANIVIKGFVSEEELIRLYEKCKIVIAPLRFGAGVKGKIIEAIYYRCAVVTTSIGVEGIDNSMGLITVNNESLKLAEDIISLYNNTERLIKIYNDSPQFINKYFSLENARGFVEKYIN